MNLTQPLAHEFQEQAVLMIELTGTLAIVSEGVPVITKGNYDSWRGRWPSS